jgi:peroxiredoxin
MFYGKNFSLIHFYLNRMTMTRVSINTLAPDFTLPDFKGGSFRLSNLRKTYNVLLVFNRTFT